MAMKPLSEQVREILALPIQHEPLSRDEQCLGVGRAQERARTAALDSLVPDMVETLEGVKNYFETFEDDYQDSGTYKMLCMALTRIRQALSEGT